VARVEDEAESRERRDENYGDEAIHDEIGQGERALQLLLVAESFDKTGARV
jgi:hypothetical protein